MLFYDLPLIDHIMNKTKSSTTFINNETVCDFLVYRPSKNPVLSLKFEHLPTKRAILPNSF